MKVETLYAWVSRYKMTEVSKIDGKVNDWIENHKDYDILSINHSTSMVEEDGKILFTVMIAYKEKSYN